MQSSMSIEVPKGMAGGQMLQANTPQGVMQVVIPEGKTAGDTFEFLLPAMPVAVPVVQQVAPVVAVPAAVVAVATVVTWKTAIPIENNQSFQQVADLLTTKVTLSRQSFTATALVAERRFRSARQLSEPRRRSSRSRR